MAVLLTTAPGGPCPPAAGCRGPGRVRGETSLHDLLCDAVPPHVSLPAPRAHLFLSEAPNQGKETMAGPTAGW